MLIGLGALLAHGGAPPAPHDLWGAWNFEPTLVLGLLLVGLAYHRGRPRSPAVTSLWRRRAFAAALGTLVLALVTPLDALAGALASAHMVQHVLLILVAAPLLAFSAPSSALLRGSPPAMRQVSSRWRRRLGVARDGLRGVRQPVVLWLAHVATVWFWHAAVPYDAALGNRVLHIVEHAMFLFTGVAFWHVVLSSRGGPSRVSPGLGVLLVFGMALQSAFLSALLTFAPSSWYAGYATTTAPWGLDPLADQHLAGAIMWVPGGFVYPAVALMLMVGWLSGLEKVRTAE